MRWTAPVDSEAPLQRLPRAPRESKPVSLSLSLLRPTEDFSAQAKVWRENWRSSGKLWSEQFPWTYYSFVSGYSGFFRNPESLPN